MTKTEQKLKVDVDVGVDDGVGDVVGVDFGVDNLSWRFSAAKKVSIFAKK